MSEFATFHISKEQETAKFARKLAPYLKEKDVLFLEGTLGAGKTLFARNLIQQLCGQDIEVPSPTFNLLLTYDSPAGEIYHYDFYRLEDPEEVWELDLEDALEDGICLMEWVSQLEDLAPEGALTVRLEIPEGEEGRRIIHLSGDESWKARLADIGAV
ncbi:tRNA (adenosine(37)-N6)-threonylcarbamoyltransferase complex ATPase subunit type 1 TsaE [Sneathiella sp. P13V-1]|uniref:tRNA (adenosine(37)-N6)-threonylcarbamoyltransferase complex ATPase subunit type 1 TsaE n=1 Tax=Sneathiella sp. P13V-1 TaxID=2697366 RepID=UPI00187B4AD5|nr:tRNA (adenosine(37)-N6)-threonylcarbamoyltransferase complex ATPase subunit type 1 TsaE [Sneathiella sp. P13V-1]MBE7636012.1 tRNA (adenosine(37)-N6)-threonylcarbamoyltransferase complex ATPase subunit type 1 TsaE [Sneathiella sp. P13V-1]